MFSEQEGWDEYWTVCMNIAAALRYRSSFQMRLSTEAMMNLGQKSFWGNMGASSKKTNNKIKVYIN